MPLSSDMVGEMKCILVTGGAGFIGSHTVVELAAAGYTPIIIDNFNNSERSVLENLKKLTGTNITCYDQDFADAEKLRGVITKEHIDGVIHFAAYKAVGESVQHPLKYYQNNIAGLLTLLDVLEEMQIPNLVFSSSCTVYGEADTLPLTEDAPMKPAVSPYGATKQFGEIIIRDTTHASKQLKSLLLRYFNPIGAHPSALIGELPKGPPSILVPFITQTVAGWRDELTVFGNDYPTTDGTCVRDYIHVVDLARAHVRALEYIAGQASGTNEICNVGTGKGSSVLEVIQTFEQVTGEKVPYHIGPRRQGDIVSSYASVNKAQDLLGWKAEKTLADALSDAWRWQCTLTKEE
jgi:UDP-glucose 4-epimerase